jgi:hypothetical protein
MRRPQLPSSDDTLYTIVLVIAALVLMAFVVCAGNQWITLDIPPSAPTFMP